MFFKKGNRWEFFIKFTSFTVNFYETLILCQFLKDSSTRLRIIEHICKIFIRNKVIFEILEWYERVHDDNDFKIDLDEYGDTLQMGH